MNKNVDECVSQILYTSLYYLSKSDHGFYTHTHWKCTNVEEPGWFTTRFDDSHWPQAIVVDHSFGFYRQDEYLNEWTGLEKFIWTSSIADLNMYCRARMCYGNFHLSKIIQSIQK